MKRLTALALSGVMMMGLMPVSAMTSATMPADGYTAPVATIFSDVTAENINAEAVSYLKGNGIVQGYADGSFGVDKNINRAEFLKILMLASANYTEETGKACLAALPAKVKSYNDIMLDAWYAPYMCVAVRDGIMEGYPDGRMRPDSAINVPEMAKIVALVMKLSLGAEGTNWYDKYITALEAKNALPSTLKQLAEQISRGEMAETTFRIKANRTDKAAVSFSELQGVPRARLASGTIGTIASCSELSRVMEDQLTVETAQRETMLKDMAVNQPISGMGGEMAPTANDAAPQTGGGSDGHSTTNVQVEGVDEGDIVKNDGRYIYTTKGNEVRIVDTQDSAEGLKEIARIATTDTNFYPSELYVDGNRLTVLGSTYEDITYTSSDQKRVGIMPPYYYGKSMTKAVLVDITNRSAPQIERTVSLEGSLSQSRRIGDKLYVVLNDYPKYWLMREQFLPVEKILPMVEDSARGSLPKPAVNCDEVQYFPGYQQPNYMTVAVIPTSDTTKDVEAKVYLGNSESIYMSPNALYVTTGASTANDFFWNWNDTQVYKFNLTANAVEQAASAKVPGRVLNQFSMDEHNGNFRIATHRNDWTEGTNSSENAVYILDGALKTLGSILNIAPGERIYAARFMGDRGYLVTFKNIDPFFVLDLATPTAPKILGELKIPGWSNYLHPYDANHIIGIGNNVEVQTASGETMDGETQPVTWQNVQGIKLSLFDVTDVQNPKEKFSTTLGTQGTYSELLYNHKALLFSKEKNLIAFPVSITTANGVKIYKECTTDANGQEVCKETGRYDDFKTTFEGAIAFTIDLTNGFTERGRISHYEGGYLDYSRTDLPEDEYQKFISRIIYIGDKFYTISQAMVKQATMDNLTVTDSVSLAK